MKTICICGGGSLGHVIAGWLAAKGKARVNILTSRPGLWQPCIDIHTPDGNTLHGKLGKVSSHAAEVIPDSDIVLLCLPGYLIASELETIRPHLAADTLVGGVFSSTGFFFEAHKILSSSQPLWGFQRVPFIARVAEYGSSANLLGFKDSLSVAIENVSDTVQSSIVSWLNDAFECPIHLLGHYLEASLTNSNPLLHTSRLYTLFGGDNEGKAYDRMIYFYEEWTDEAADMLIRMDEEFFRLLGALPVSEGFLPTILDYYESHDAQSLAAKLRSIKGFKGITSPMVSTSEGWMPDFGSRYFTEDFPHGLKYIWLLAHEHGIDVPNIDKVYAWGMDKLNKGGR